MGVHQAFAAAGVHHVFAASGVHQTVGLAAAAVDSQLGAEVVSALSEGLGPQLSPTYPSSLFAKSAA